MLWLTVGVAGRHRTRGGNAEIAPPVLITGKRPASLTDEPIEQRRLHQGEDGVDRLLLADLVAQCLEGGEPTHDPGRHGGPLGAHLDGEDRQIGVGPGTFEHGEDQSRGASLGGGEHAGDDG